MHAPSILLGLAAFFFALPNGVCAQSLSREAATIRDLGIYLDAQARNDGFTGTVLVARGGAVLFAKAYGMADRAKAIPNSVDTRDDIASLGKTFTAVAILQLVEKGLLKLDARIIDILPDYPNREAAGRITIHQLLTHSSGLMDWTADPVLYMEKRKTLRSVASYLPLFVDAPLEFAPGTRFSYTNSGFIVLGLMIEKISGLDYYDYVEKWILAAAGMTSTSAPFVDALPPEAAVGYTQYQEDLSYGSEWRSNTFVVPMRGASDGGWYSTPGDIFAFSQALLGNRLLGASYTELLLKGKIQADGPSRLYAYGFQERFEKGQRIVGHGGSFAGWNCFLDMYMDSGYVVIAMTNRDGGAAPVRDFFASRQPF